MTSPPLRVPPASSAINEPLRAFSPQNLAAVLAEPLLRASGASTAADHGQLDDDDRPDGQPRAATAGVDGLSEPGSSQGPNAGPGDADAWRDMLDRVLARICEWGPLLLRGR